MTIFIEPRSWEYKARKCLLKLRISKVQHEKSSRVVKLLPLKLFVILSWVNILISVFQTGYESQENARDVFMLQQAKFQHTSG